eukprot:TRINITY_DN27216_c0_g1_i3.p1 TRINITY_DN27216_c0_g1~~TRINITY_DN27216_c0_g1_i3.p1  ORF type:complete len:227 (+),score=9.66 TRINITY_DN27216_c0_g1_i3:56-736(+)
MSRVPLSCNQHDGIMGSGASAEAKLAVNEASEIHLQSACEGLTNANRSRLLQVLRKLEHDTIRVSVRKASGDDLATLDMLATATCEDIRTQLLSTWPQEGLPLATLMLRLLREDGAPLREQDTVLSLIPEDAPEGEEASCMALCVETGEFRVSWKDGLGLWPLNMIDRNCQDVDSGKGRQKLQQSEVVKFLSYTLASTIPGVKCEISSAGSRSRAPAGLSCSMPEI